jgi:hypothetical protein
LVRVGQAHFQPQPVSAALKETLVKINNLEVDL